MDGDQNYTFCDGDYYYTFCGGDFNSEVPLVLLEHVGGVGYHDHPQSHKTLPGFQGVYDNGDGDGGDNGNGDSDSGSGSNVHLCFSSPWKL